MKRIPQHPIGHSLTGAQNLTIQPVTLGAVQVVGPEFVGYTEARLLFGLSRTHLWKLGKEGQVQTVSLRAKGRTRGRRLYSVASIRALLDAAMGGAK
jgi:hypothetical protein